MEEAIAFNLSIFLSRGLVVILVLPLWACGDSNSKVGSQGVFTKDIFAEIHVTNDNGKTIAVEAQLKVGGNTTSFLDLEEGDHLIASVLGHPDEIHLSENLFNRINQLSDGQKRMTASEDLTFDFLGHRQLGPKGVWYHTVFDVADPETEFIVSLIRRNKTSAPDSKIVLPASFEITSPLSASDIVYSRRQEIPIRWSPSGSVNGVVKRSQRGAAKVGHLG